MDKMPKRRKSQDNPYILNKDEENGIYIISFKDALGVHRKVAVNKELFEAFNNFELEDITQMNEFDRHIEHSQVYANNLNKRALDKPLDLEDEFIKKASFENLKKAIELLPEIQKRRIKKYYFDEKTLEEIGKEENCSKVAIKLSLKVAIKKLKEILKNF